MPDPEVSTTSADPGTTGTTTEPGTTQPSTTTTQPATREPARQSGFTYQEDRSDWIPRHRFNEESTKRQATESQLAEANRRVKALAGVEADPNSTDAQRQRASDIRAALYETVPELQELIDSRESVNEAVTGQWARHGREMLADLSREVSTALGGDLAPRAQGKLSTAFISLIEREVIQSKHQGQKTKTLMRYENGDKTLITDFAKEWAEDWIEPARRKVAAQDAQRMIRRVPDSRGGSPAQTSAPIPKFKTLDERLDFAAGVYKERGGAFGR